MKLSTFKEKNMTLNKPEGLTDDECGALDVYRDGRTCLSCWRASWRERLSILFFGRVWVWVWSGWTQPPISLLGAKTAFVSPTLWGRVKALMLKPVRIYRIIEEGEHYKIGLIKENTHGTKWSWYWLLVLPYWRARGRYRCQVIRFYKFDGRLYLNSTSGTIGGA